MKQCARHSAYHLRMAAMREDGAWSQVLRSNAIPALIDKDSVEFVGIDAQIVADWLDEPEEMCGADGCELAVLTLPLSELDFVAAVCGAQKRPLAGIGLRETDTQPQG